MKLDRYGRDNYEVTITTNPEVTAWEASFDSGLTWWTGTPHPNVADVWVWLVAGPKVDQGPAVAVITRRMRPKVRAVENPLIVVLDAPPIYLRLW